jgi:hypothetical protein
MRRAENEVAFKVKEVFYAILATDPMLLAI